MAQLMTNSLTEIDKDLPENLDSLDSKFQSFRTTFEANHELIGEGIEFLETSPIFMIAVPESEKLSQMIANLSDLHQALK